MNKSGSEPSEMTVNRSSVGSAFADGQPQYEVYALRNATSDKVGKVTLYWRGGPDYNPGEPTPTTAVYFFLIKGPDLNILFDAGVTRETARVRPVLENYEDPASLLGRLGLRPEDIGGVILSHAHWDHVDGIRLFPNANVYVQEACYDWTVKVAPQYDWLRKNLTPVPEDIEKLVKLHCMGTLRMIRGMRAGDPIDILPGISVLRVDGHYMGCQAAIVKTTKGSVILTGDSVNLYDNFESDWPPGICFTGLTDAWDGMSRFREILKSGGLLVPGHDLAIMEKFPVVKPGIVRIA
jgi:glyoxylase-like metal-dependent hydrolase (beta-lactamase superfamily II)